MDSWVRAPLGQWMWSVFFFQNYWVSALCPSSGILDNRKHNVPETESVPVLRWGDGDTYFVGSLRKSWPQTLDYGRWPKSGHPVILSVIHHRQNPLDSTCFCFLLQRIRQKTWDCRSVSDEAYKASVINMPKPGKLDVLELTDRSCHTRTAREIQLCPYSSETDHICVR
jgi:hypothetical protein